MIALCQWLKRHESQERKRFLTLTLACAHKDCNREMESRIDVDKSMGFNGELTA